MSEQLFFFLKDQVYHIRLELLFPLFLTSLPLVAFSTFADHLSHSYSSEMGGKCMCHQINQLLGLEVPISDHPMPLEKTLFIQ